MPIEVEIRSFISPEKYQELLAFFHQTAEFVNEDEQETHYFDTPEDIRIQKNNFFSKIWWKKGKIHDDQREEIEVKCLTEDFQKLEKLFQSLGISTTIKWFRTRHTFLWKGTSVMLDYTRGYGYILELEKMSSAEEKETALQELQEKLAQLGLPVTPKEEFNQKYQYYKEHWKELVQ